MRLPRKLLRFFLWFLGVFSLILLVFVACFYFAVNIDPPTIVSRQVMELPREKIETDFYKIGNNWLRKSDSGLWEMYISGNGFERGVKEGKLHQELAYFQEEAFVSQISKMVPSEWMLNYLKYFIAFFNRNLDTHILPEYQREIYGESLYASDKFDFIAPKYHRLLNYHAAHDIGHAIQDKGLRVGCTSFGAWGQSTKDSSLLIARNFDFFVGQDFAKNKIINFVHPEKGYKLAFVSWAGMIGAVSGMNEMGLTVTINASKSDIPTSAATPISLVSREILQYAKSIEEAFAIAKKRKVFVSESILIGSQLDEKVAIIEMSPTKIALYESSNNTIICSNHFQSELFKEEDINIQNIKNSSSNYRYKLVTELIQKNDQLDVENSVAILRNKNGLNGKKIGFGNEKAINQLIAHHSVVFKPKQLQMWVSTKPYQLGQFICYDLNEVFGLADTLSVNQEIYNKNLSVAEDSFLHTSQFANFQKFLKMKSSFKNENIKNTAARIESFIQTNPNNYEVYVLIANGYRKEGLSQKAIKYYKIALTKEVATNKEKLQIQENIKELTHKNDTRN